LPAGAVVEGCAAAPFVFAATANFDETVSTSSLSLSLSSVAIAACAATGAGAAGSASSFAAAGDCDGVCGAAVLPAMDLAPAGLPLPACTGFAGLPAFLTLEAAAADIAFVRSTPSSPSLTLLLACDGCETVWTAA